MLIIPAAVTQVAAEVPRPVPPRPGWRRVLVVLVDALTAPTASLPPGHSVTGTSPPTVTQTDGVVPAEATAVTRIDPGG